MHRVVDRQAGGDDTAGAVDIHRDFFLRVLGLEVQKLRHDQLAHAVMDGAGDEDDALFKKAREDVVGTLATGCLLNNHGDEVHVGLDRVFHRVSLLERDAYVDKHNVLPES